MCDIRMLFVKYIWRKTVFERMGELLYIPSFKLHLQPCLKITLNRIFLSHLKLHILHLRLYVLQEQENSKFNLQCNKFSTSSWFVFISLFKVILKNLNLDKSHSLRDFFGCFPTNILQSMKETGEGTPFETTKQKPLEALEPGCSESPVISPGQGYSVTVNMLDSLITLHGYQLTQVTTVRTCPVDKMCCAVFEGRLFATNTHFPH